MKAQVVIDKNKCVGCRTCELACSFQKSQVFNPVRANIKIYINAQGCLDIKVASQCECLNVLVPLCVELCPADAIDFCLL